MINTETFLSIFIWGVVATVGLLIGFIIAEHKLRVGLAVAIKGVGRILLKSLKRRIYPSFDLMRLERDRNFIHLPMDERNKFADKFAIKIAVTLKHKLDEKFNSQ